MQTTPAEGKLSGSQQACWLPLSLLILQDQSAIIHIPLDLKIMAADTSSEDLILLAAHGNVSSTEWCLVLIALKIEYLSTITWDG